MKFSRPYDVTDVIEQYSQGHLSLTNKVNQVQVKVDQMADQLNRQQILFNNLGLYLRTKHKYRTKHLYQVNLSNKYKTNVDPK